MFVTIIAFGSCGMRKFWVKKQNYAVKRQHLVQPKIFWFNPENLDKSKTIFVIPKDQANEC